VASSDDFCIMRCSLAAALLSALPESNTGLDIVEHSVHKMLLEHTVWHCAFSIHWQLATASVL
jgi:hypothetical protein